ATSAITRVRRRKDKRGRHYPVLHQRQRQPARHDQTVVGSLPGPIGAAQGFGGPVWSGRRFSGSSFHPPLSGRDSKQEGAGFFCLRPFPFSRPKKSCKLCLHLSVKRVLTLLFIAGRVVRQGMANKFGCLGYECTKFNFFSVVSCRYCFVSRRAILRFSVRAVIPRGGHLQNSSRARWNNTQGSHWGRGARNHY